MNHTDYAVRKNTVSELYVSYESDDKIEAVKDIRVHRIHMDFQGMGLGKLLMKNVIDTLAAEGYSEFTFGVEDDNERALYICKRFGFSDAIARKYEKYQDGGYEYSIYLKCPL